MPQWALLRMKDASAKAHWVQIWIAGDIADIRRSCQRFCERGLCVTVTPTTYVYTGGFEPGACVRLINYPRFPSEPKAIEARAFELAERLRAGLCQDSWLVETPERMYWHSRRGDEK